MTNFHLPSGADQGPDDFIAKHGAIAFAALVTAALPFDAVERVRAYLACGPDRAPDLLDDMPLMLLASSESSARRVKIEQLVKRANLPVRELRNAMRNAKALYDSKIREGMSSGSSSAQFETDAGCTYEIEDDGPGTRKLLAKFIFRIDREIEIHRGDMPPDKWVEGHIEFANGSPMTIRLRSGELQSPRFMYEKVGARATIVEGPKGYPRLLEASQTLSDPEVISAFGSTGFALGPNGERMYVHAGGALGADGVRAEFDEFLKPYRFPSVPSDRELIRKSVLHVLSLLDAADPQIAVAMVAFGIRSILSEIQPVPATLFLLGSTGSLKTTLTAAVMRLFGEAWTENDFLSFHSTANFLEAALHLANCVPAVVDDFVKNGGARRNDLDDLAERLFRAVGNNAARGRCNADGSTRPHLRPRCGLIVTGEHAPHGHSLVGRILFVTFREGSVNKGALTAWKQNRQAPSIATAAFISEFVLANYEQLRETMPGRVEHLRDAEFADLNAHPRTPTNLANLFYAWLLFLEYARVIEAIDDAAFDELAERGRSALRKLGEAQATYVSEADPCNIFIDVLASLISQGKAYIPALGAEDVVMPSSCARVGWFTGKHADTIAIDESAAFTLVNRELAAAQRAPLPNLAALRKNLVAKGIAFPGQKNRDDERSQFMTSSGMRVNVIRVPAQVLLGDGAPTPTSSSATKPKAVSDAN